MAKAAGQATSKALLALIEKGNAADGTRIEEVRQLATQYADATTYARNLIARKLLTKWQITQLSRGTWQLSLGKYRLLDERGIGRIGRELVAEHVNLGRKVVIKLVSRILTSNPGRLQRFMVDFRKVAAIDYPHLVHSFDVDQENNRYFVVTEFVDGDNLEQRIQREDPLTPELALHLLHQAAKGLSYAAAQGMIHGDLKPANLVVDKNNNLKVTDLGYVRLIDGSEVSSEKTKDAQEQAFHAGLEYRAPEQLNGTADWSDPRLDLYSFGQILFYLLTGAKPEAPLADRAARRDLINERVPELAPAIADLYAKLTSPDPADRPKSWADVLPVFGDSAPKNGAVSDSKTISKAELAPAVVAAKKNGASAPAPASSSSPVPKKAAAPKAPIKPTPKIEEPAEELEEEAEVEETSAETPSEKPAFDFSSFTPPAKTKPKTVPAKAEVPVKKAEAPSAKVEEKKTPKVEEKKPEIKKEVEKPVEKKVVDKKPTKPTEKAAPIFAVEESSDNESSADNLADELVEEEVDESAAEEEKPSFDFGSFAPVDRTKPKTPAAKIDPKKPIKAEEKKTPPPKVENKKTTKPTSKAADDEESTDGDAASEAEAPQKKTPKAPVKLNPKLVMAGAAGVLIVLLGIGSLVVYMLMGGKGKPKAEPDKKEVAKSTDEKNSETSPEKSADEKKTAESVKDDANPKKTDDEELNPADLKKNTPAPMLDPANNVALVDPLANPQPAEAKPEEMKPEEPKTEEPKPNVPAEPPPEENKPAEAPPPKVQPPAPQVDPLKDLPPFFKLPEVAADKPETVGPLNLAGKTCLIELHGGANAFRGKLEIDMKPADGGTSRDKWEIKIAGKPGEQPTLIAMMRLFENQLQFAWTDAAKSQPAAPYLMNCMMRLSAGSFTKNIIFRQPAVIPPLKIDFDKPAPLKFAFENAPDPKNLRVELLASPELGFPNPDFKPERTFEAGKTNNYIWVGDKDNERFLGLRVDSKPSVKGLELTLSAAIRLDANQPDKPLPYSKKNFTKGLQTAENLVASSNQAKEIAVDTLEKQGLKKEQAQATVDADLKAKEEVRNRFKLISDIMGRMHQQATLHVRVTYDTEAGKIIIAETEGAPPIAAPKK